MRFDCSAIWEFPYLVVLNLVVCNFYAEALFCAHLHPFADLRLSSFADICALLRTSACFCIRPRLERPRLGTAEQKRRSSLLSWIDFRESPELGALQGMASAISPTADNEADTARLSGTSRCNMTGFPSSKLLLALNLPLQFALCFVLCLGLRFSFTLLAVRKQTTRKHPPAIVAHVCGTPCRATRVAPHVSQQISAESWGFFRV